MLDTARSIAVERGIGAVTIGAVAEQMGVTRPVVYSCFDDRITLLEALLQRERAALLEAALTALQSARGDDPETVFVRGYQTLLQAVGERVDAWRLVFSANPDPAVADVFAGARAIIIESATRHIGPVLGRWWKMRDAERKLPVLIELFVSSCEAAMRSLLTSSSTWSADELGELYGRAMYRALSKA